MTQVSVIMEKNSKVKVILPSFLVKQPGTVIEFELYGHSLRDIIIEMSKEYPSLEKNIIEEGKISPLICVFLDGDILSSNLALDYSLDDGATITILQSIVGG